MRHVILALMIAVVVSAPAEARVHVIAPPGSSGVSQYDETIPTAGGSRPTNTVHPVGGGSLGSGGGGSAGGGAVAPSTQRALTARGPAGVAAAALAQATAPSQPRSVSKAGGAPRSSIPTASSGNVSSPFGSVLKVVTGSTSSGGLGTVLPVILIGSLLGAAALALVRRWRAG